jgi:hypothetical protein
MPHWGISSPLPVRGRGCTTNIDRSYSRSTGQEQVHGRQPQLDGPTVAFSGRRHIVELERDREQIGRCLLMAGFA